MNLYKPLTQIVYQNFNHPNTIYNPQYLSNNYTNPHGFIQYATYKNGESPQMVYRDEVFKPLIFNSRFIIGNHGTIYDTTEKCLIKPSIVGGYFVAYHKEFGNISVHRALMLTFSPINNNQNLEVNHKDGNKLHNYWHPINVLSNLEWVTHKQNVQHAYDIGLNIPTVGEDKYNAIYTNDEVRLICEMLQSGYSSSEIGKAIGRSGYNFLRFIHNLRKGIAWTWLTCDYNLTPAIRHSEEEIRIICELLSQGYSNEEISIKIKNDFNFDILPGFIKTIRYGNPNWAHVIKDYTFPSQLHRPYSESDVHLLCTLLEQNKSFSEIANIMEREVTDSFRNFVNNVRNGYTYTNISSQYHFFRERKIDDPLSTDEVIAICEGLVKKLTAKQIAEDILHRELTHSLKTKISQIKKKKSFKSITMQYNFE